MGHEEISGIKTFLVKNPYILMVNDPLKKKGLTDEKRDKLRKKKEKKKT